jgi:hypothetical protein
VRSSSEYSKALPAFRNLPNVFPYSTCGKCGKCSKCSKYGKYYSTRIHVDYRIRPCEVFDLVHMHLVHMHSVHMHLVHMDLVHVHLVHVHLVQCI